MTVFMSFFPDHVEETIMKSLNQENHGVMNQERKKTKNRAQSVLHVLWGMNITNGKQYSLSVWSQLSWIAVSSSFLRDAPVSWNIFLRIPPKSFDIWTVLLAIAGNKKKHFNTLCFGATCIFLISDLIINKPFDWWNQKNVQNFHLHLYIYRAVNDCHLLWLFPWHAAPFYQCLWKCTYFFQNDIFMFHWTFIKEKFWHHPLTQVITKFYYHPVIHRPWLFLCSSL